MTINPNGTYQLLYGVGGVLRGIVRVTFDEQLDGSKSARYSFYGSDEDLWISFAKDNSDVQTELLSGHDGAMKFTRAPENDYHKTSAEVEADDYLGIWSCGRCTIVICNGGSTCLDYTFTENGKGTFTEKYGDGRGKFVLREGNLTWQDDKENSGESMTFLKSSAN